MEASTTTTMTREIQNNASKESARQSSSISPPPAYTPRVQSLQTLSQLQQLASTHNQPGCSPFIMSRPPLTAILDDTLDDDDSESSEGISPISLRINTAVVVTKNNNLVCLSDTPASHANAIARAVVQAIQENSSGQCGIPMIDEDGRPRPVNIQVDAGITVDGAGNIVANEAIINKVLSERSRLRKREEDEEESDEAGMASKRRRTSRSISP